MPPVTPSTRGFGDKLAAAVSVAISGSRMQQVCAQEPGPRHDTCPPPQARHVPLGCGAALPRAGAGAMEGARGFVKLVQYSLGLMYKLVVRQKG